jgi:hypothetical protein
MLNNYPNALYHMSAEVPKLKYLAVLCSDVFCFEVKSTSPPNTTLRTRTANQHPHLPPHLPSRRHGLRRICPGAKGGVADTLPRLGPRNLAQLETSFEDFLPFSNHLLSNHAPLCSARDAARSSSVPSHPSPRAAVVVPSPRGSSCRLYRPFIPSSRACFHPGKGHLDRSKGRGAKGNRFPNKKVVWLRSSLIFTALVATRAPRPTPVHLASTPRALHLRP